VALVIEIYLRSEPWIEGPGGHLHALPLHWHWSSLSRGDDAELAIYTCCQIFGRFHSIWASCYVDIQSVPINLILLLFSWFFLLSLLSAFVN
jgi:hypothetical protein